ncbi:hypothetical protein JCM10213_007211 [Rhodosporidiobolus nylandii]
MKRGFLLGKKLSTAPSSTPAPAAAPSTPSPTADQPIVPLPLPSTTSFRTSPADSSTLHWSFHPSSAPTLALYSTSATRHALRSTPFFSSPSSSPPPLPAYKPLYELVDLPGKGKGLVATADLAPDSLILLDRPLLVFATTALPPAAVHGNALLSHALSRLSPEMQRTFLALDNCFPSSSSSEGSLLGRVETNALPVVSLTDLPAEAGADAVQYSGVFPRASRVNHACDANCRLEWSARDWTLAVKTSRAVKKGEELCISYIVPFQKRRERREELRLKWRFDCMCGWCSLSHEESAKKDEEREKLAEAFMRQWNAQANGA